MTGPIDFFCEIEGIDELERAFDATAHEMSDAVRRAVAEGVQAGADEARRNHFYQDRTGALTKSIKGYVEISTPGGAVGVIEANTKYDKIIERGSRAHEIVVRKAGALHWTAGGSDHFAKKVQHPGTRPYPFMKQAGIFAEKHMERALESEMLHNIEKHLAG